ncbi:putative non-LTR retroelement reverse transcriptase related protein, partial [Trifolium medium]|nr:putative non-LTR retroelement reverse transcriptase related protein [Trifolium medium]
MLVDREGLWYRVLVARYGEERGRLREGRRRGSSWWREIVRIREGVGVLGGGWFGESVSRRVGDGLDTFFWTDPWLGEISLRERFRRLFDLSEHQSSTVAEMSSLGWEVGGGAWYPDRWQWRHDPDRGYSVRGAYHLLTSQQPLTLDA